MLQLNREIILRTLRYIAITAGIFMLTVFAIYWVNTGRIFIHTPQGVGVKSISYCTTICENLTTAERTDSTMVPRGEYVARVLLDNNTDYVSNVTVDGFFATTTINPKSYKHDFSASSSRNSQFILPLGQGLLVYNADEIATTVNSTFQPAQRPLAAAMHIDDNQTLLLYGTTSKGEASTADALAVIYNQNSNTTRTLGAITDATSSSTVYQGNDALYVLNRDAGRITKVSAGGVSTISLPSSIKPSSNATLPIVALNGETLAVLSGNDFASDEDASQPTSASIVTIYSLKDFSKTSEINIGKRSDILGLSLSPDNSFVVTVGDSSLTSYEIKSGKNILSVPAVTNDTNTPIWKDGSSFVYQEGVGGVYMASLSAREAYSIIDNSILQINNITTVANDKVYLTGSAASSSPVGETDSRAESSSYVITLNSSENQTTDSGESSITRSLPHSSSNYSIGYHFSNQKTILDIDSDEHSHNLAIRTIYKLGYDPGNYSFNFLQYTNPFKEGR